MHPILDGFSGNLDSAMGVYSITVMQGIILFGLVGDVKSATESDDMLKAPTILA